MQFLCLDQDDDDDGFVDAEDEDPFDANVCIDVDGDECNECASGSYDFRNDGLDSDLDVICDVGDDDDDNDGCGDGLDPAPLAPSEDFARQCVVSCDPGERTLPAVVSLCGEDCVVFATDYPHPDAVSGDLVAKIAEQPELSERAKQKMLRTTAQRCSGLG